MNLSEFKSKIEELEIIFETKLNVDIKLFSISVDFNGYKLICPNFETTIETLPSFLEKSKLKQ